MICVSDDFNQDVAKELVAQTAGKAYDDLAHPTAKSVGNTLSLFPRTIGVWLGKWEKWVINGEESIRLTAQAVQDKAIQIPEEKLTEPEAYVAIPAVHQLSYCYNSEDLREMYANLLVSSMNTDTKQLVHPSFVDIIKQLTPDEAKLLSAISEESGTDYKSLTYIPLIDLQLQLDKGQGHICLLRNYTNMGDNICESPQNISAYLENLDRLKLICILEDIHLTDNAKYLPLESSYFYLSYKELELAPGQSFVTKKKSFYVTSFGEAFIRTCIQQ